MHNILQIYHILHYYGLILLSKEYNNNNLKVYTSFYIVFLNAVIGTKII